MAQTYSAEQVSRHDSERDLWMTMHGGVYDLTQFLHNHPGGEEVLLQLAGRDGSACFDEIGHSEEARQLRETFLIGRIESGGGGGGGGGDDRDAASSSSIERKGPSVEDDDWVYEPPEKKSSPALPIFLGVGALVYALLFYYVF